jgi:hypothetical protein
MTESANNSTRDTARRSLPLPIDHSIALWKSGLVICNAISFQRWERAGSQLISFTESTAWWIADWLVYGENNFHDRYREAIENTSLSYQTLRNYAWVARRFDLPRRRDDLSFGHHAEVAALDLPERDYWLRKSEELGWSRNQLRNNVRTSLKERQAREEQRPPTACAAEPGELSAFPEVAAQRQAGPPNSELILRLTREQVNQFATVADKQTLPVDKWAIQVLETAASEHSPGTFGGHARMAVSG